MSATDSSASTPTAPPPASPPATSASAPATYDTSSAEASAAVTGPKTQAGSAERSGGEAGHVDVSIVLPCYNEQDHVIAEVERITKAMDASGLSYELLAVDDASTDDTLKLL